MRKTATMEMYDQVVNYFHAIRFFLVKKNCKVIHFKVPTAVMVSYLDYDVVGRTSELIEKIRTLSPEEKQDFEKTRLVLKLGWLIKDIMKRGVITPFHLINSGSKYHCFQGTTRVLVTTYIQPSDFIEGYFLWYPEMDPNPFILDYEHREITSPIEFVKLFRFKQTSITYTRLSNDLDVTDGADDKRGGFAQFRFAKACFEKTVGTYDVPFITGADREHWQVIKDLINIDDIIQFKGDECILSNVRFKKINERWVAV